jgi:hypothetical protein
VEELNKKERRRYRLVEENIDVIKQVGRKRKLKKNNQGEQESDDEVVRRGKVKYDVIEDQIPSSSIKNENKGEPNKKGQKRDTTASDDEEKE